MVITIITAQKLRDPILYILGPKKKVKENANGLESNKKHTLHLNLLHTEKFSFRYLQWKKNYFSVKELIIHLKVVNST